MYICSGTLPDTTVYLQVRGRSTADNNHECPAAKRCSSVVHAVAPGEEEATTKWANTVGAIIGGAGLVTGSTGERLQSLCFFCRACSTEFAFPSEADLTVLLAMQLALEFSHCRPLRIQPDLALPPHYS